MTHTHNFKAIRHEVNDFDSSILFYQNLGCTIQWTEERKNCISVYLKFSPDSEMLIHLLKTFQPGEELRMEEMPGFEIVNGETDLEEINTNLDKFISEYLIFLSPEVVIPWFNEFRSMDVFGLEFIDNYEEHWKKMDEFYGVSVGDYLKAFSNNKI